MMNPPTQHSSPDPGAATPAHQRGDVDNPMPHTLPEGENATPLEVIGSTASDKLVICMVGLPATGKTHIAKRICRFLSFFHDIPSQIFNVGDYRRQLCGAQLPAAFYDPTNETGMAARKLACDAALTDLMEYMKQTGTNVGSKGKGGVRVAALDATNSTYERRQYIYDTIKRKGGLKLMFVESICDQDELLEENIRKVKLSTPDYRNIAPEQAVQDFKARRQNYMQVYEPLDERDGPYIKIINSRQFMVHNIRGYLPLKVVHFVMNLHTMPRTFYLTRHGQSEYNLLGKIGGDSGLTPAGIEYARRLAQFAKEYISKEDDYDSEEEESGVAGGDKGTGAEAATTLGRDDSPKQGSKVESQPPPSSSSPQHHKRSPSSFRLSSLGRPINEHGPIPCRLWTSTLRRTKETAQFIDHNTIQYTWDNGDTAEWVQFRAMPRRNLDELYAGICDGMTYKEIEQVYPEEFARRQDDKLAYRYPRGESYMDVTLRLEPLAQEMERTREPVLIVAHQGILRILYAYFMGLDRKEAPYVSIPLNNVIELSPHAYGCHEKRFCLMMKEEMLNDGQDEPVTSMPPANHGHQSRNVGGVSTCGPGPDNDNALTAASETKGILLKPPDDSPEKPKKRTSAPPSAMQNTHYSPTDPIMNAPSC